MNKQEVQQRVSQNGKPLDLNKFEWDEKTKTFSSAENELVIDFNKISGCTFTTGSNCIFNTGSLCTFNTGIHCTFTTGSNCSFDTYWGCTFKTDSYCTFSTGSNCTFNTGNNCAFKTGMNCTFKTGWECVFNTGSYCTFNTGDSCTFGTGRGCTFNTGDSCAFNTGSYCTFNTGSVCTFNICWDCIFNTTFTKNNVLIVRFETTKKIYDLETLPKDKMVYFEKNKYFVKDSIEIKNIDNTLTVIKSSRTFKDYTFMTCQKVKDYFTDKGSSFKVVSKIYNNKTYYAHCDVFKKGIKDVDFKIASENFDRNKIAQDIKAKNNIIDMFDYRLITGACEHGTLEWLREKGFEDTQTFDIKDFIANYKNDETCWNIEQLIEFYEDYIKE